MSVCYDAEKCNVGVINVQNGSEVVGNYPMLMAR